MRIALCLALLLVLPSLARAELRSYQLDPEDTEVAFVYGLGGLPGNGSMPVDSADLQLDFRQIGRSQVAVTLAASDARADLPFVASTMKGPTILDTANHPTIRFESTEVRPTNQGVVLAGDLTIRGITRPVELTARFFRKPDRDPADLRRLTILLEGNVSRAAFGAIGFADLVDDTVGLRILASIDRQE